MPGRRSGQLLPGAAIVTVSLVLLGGCKPEYPRCDNDQQCTAHKEVCVNGLCQQCRDPGQCAACQQCNLGRCQAIAGCCRTPADCAAGELCQNGHCGPQQCMSNAECGTGQSCTAGVCAAAPTCRVDGDCAAGQTCSPNQVCVAPSPQSCKLNRVYFGFDSSNLTPEAEAILQANAACLKASKAAQVLVEGHCDERGTEDYNLTLGERRARTVQRFLQRLGVEGARAISYGSHRPLVDGHNEASWAQNRRAEILVP